MWQGSPCIGTKEAIVWGCEDKLQISLEAPRCWRAVGYMLSRPAYRVLSQPKERRYCCQQSWKAWEKQRATKLFDIRHRAPGSEVCPTRFQSCFVQYVLAMTSCSLFWNDNATVCWKSVTCFCFNKGLQLRDRFESQKRLWTSFLSWDRFLSVVLAVLELTL